MRIKLFKIEVEGRDDTFIAARRTPHAAEIFVGAELLADRELGYFAVSRVEHELPADRQFGLEYLLDHGVCGVAKFDPAVGWIVPEPAA